MTNPRWTHSSRPAGGESVIGDQGAFDAAVNRPSTPDRETARFARDALAACQEAEAVGHPTSDPGDGRTRCRGCKRYVWPVIHSCPMPDGDVIEQATRPAGEIRQHPTESAPASDSAGRAPTGGTANQKIENCRKIAQLRERIARELWLIELGQEYTPELEAQWQKILTFPPGDRRVGEWGGWAADADAILAHVRTVVAEKDRTVTQRRARIDETQEILAETESDARNSIWITLSEVEVIRAALDGRDGDE